MPNGIAVLQAAFAGKRVGYRRPDGVIAWYEPAEFLGNFVGLDVIRREWQIEEPTLTFTEAVAAMDAGQTVTKGDGSTQFRWEDTDYWYRTEGDQEWFPDAVFGWEEIHATDWRIVREAPTDERPTLQEAADCLAHTPKLLCVNDAVTALHHRWPAMFREEAN